MINRPKRRKTSRQFGYRIVVRWHSVVPSQAIPERRCIGDYRPRDGGYCSGCRRELPRIPQASTHDGQHVLALIDTGRTVEAIKFLRERFKMGLADSKLAVEHMYPGGPRPLGPPCPSCGKPLRTS